LRETANVTKTLQILPRIGIDIVNKFSGTDDQSKLYSTFECSLFFSIGV
jgi:hypothetical protein